MLKKTFLVLMLIMLALPNVALANVGNANIKDEAVNPGDILYSFKRLAEKIEEKMQFSDQAKLKFARDLFKIRMSELKYIAERKRLGVFQTTSERLAYFAGKLAENSQVTNNPLVKGDVVNEFSQYQPVLAQLRDLYPANSSYWMLIQHDINSLQILSKKLQ